LADRSPSIIRRSRLWPLSGRRAQRDAISRSSQDVESARPKTEDRSDLPPLLLTDPVVPATTASPATPDKQTAPKRADPADDGTPYLNHFGLRTRPFSLLPDPDFLFWSPSHQRAHAVLEYGLMSRAPLTLVTGEIGAGKTTLVHQLLRGLGKDIRVGLISNASGLRGELLYWVLMALGEDPSREAEHAAIFDTFQKCLIDTYAGGRRVVLIFDEAQTLDRDKLEELRMLTNINTGSDVLLQVVLVGQPELRDTVLRGDMGQFTQRVAASFHLPAMERDIQRRYIDHRLRVAGAEECLFDEGALERIHRATGGVPRLTNQLCDLAMLYAYSADKPVIDEACVKNVVDDGVLLGASPAARDGRQEEREAAQDRPATGPAGQ